MRDGARSVLTAESIEFELAVWLLVRSTTIECIYSHHAREFADQSQSGARNSMRA